MQGMKNLTAIMAALTVMLLIGFNANAQTAPPVITPIGAQSVNEGQLLTFNITTSDVDLTIPALSITPTPAGASFVDNGDGTGTFSWTPTFAQSGVFNVTFRAVDTVTLADTTTEVVTITVNNVNQAPVLAAIGAQSVNEGVLLTFNATASDPDATTPTFGSVGLPVGASFVDNADGTATFSWTPNFTQAGVFNVTFFTSDGAIADTEIVAITVNNVNQAPVLAAIGAQSVNEGVLLTFNATATDPDATTPTFGSASLPVGASFVDNANGTATFTWTPTFAQAGVFNVTFFSTDGAIADTEIVVITVNNVNQAPVLAAIGAQSVNEGVLLTFNATATDPDATTPTFGSAGLPVGASFVDNANGTATFSWTPNFTQAGVFNVTFFTTDGAIADTEIVAITVNNVNQAPVLAAIGAQAIGEGQLLTFNATASDPDATTPTFGSAGLPLGASFVDNANGTATFSWTPNFTQAGVFNVTFFTTDGAIADTEIVAITVNNVNQAPVLAAIGAQAIGEGQLLTFNASASDPDATTPTFGSAGLPLGASFVDNANGTATFSWTPNFTQSGIYNVTFFTSDGAISDTEIVAITVSEISLPPVLAAIGPQSTNEGQLLTFNATATDPDLTTPTLSATGLPSGASFVDNANGTGTFTWTPTFAQAGVFNVTFTASDGAIADTEIVAITVNNVNQAPVLAAIGAQSVNEGVLLTFNATASDPDATTPTFGSANLPVGASFVDNANGTATFSWTPNFIQSGVYNVTFFTTDGAIADTEIVAITVNDFNPTPVLASIGPRGTQAGTTLAFTVNATDADAAIPALTTSTLPVGALFTDNADGTGSFSWPTTLSDDGGYSVTFFASDGNTVDSEVVAITITANDVSPVFGALADTTIDENQSLTLTPTATDANGPIPALTVENLPVGATFLDNGNGTGTFNWTPTFTDAGVYSVRFIATDLTLLADTATVQITVNNVNRVPVLTAIGAQSGTENLLFTFGATASDPDATTPTLTASPIPSGATFTDNGNGTASFGWTPSFVQSGVYNITVVASDGQLADSEVVVVTINDAGNQIPVISAIPDTTIDEQQPLALTVTATDADLTIATLTSSVLPSGATLVDNGNNTASFNWTPSLVQAGVYTISFFATDPSSVVDTEVVQITVLDQGRPVLALIGPKVVQEGTNLTFNVSAIDPNSTIPSLTAAPLPPNASFTDNGNGTGTFVFNPDLSQGGLGYQVRFIASDGILSDTELVAISVVNTGNLPPTITPIPDAIVQEGDSLIVPITSFDSDGGLLFPTLSVSSALQSYTLTNNGNGTGVLRYRPTFFDAGVDTVRVFSTDQGIPQASAQAVFVITTLERNQAPLFRPAGPYTVLANRSISFTLSATDSTDNTPGNRLFLSVLNPPANLTFVDLGNGNAMVSFSPTSSQVGLQTINFLAVDEGIPALSTTLAVQINVRASNLPPVLGTIGPRLVTEGQLLTINMSATDPDTTGTITMRVVNNPTGAVFTDNGNATASFVWTPTFNQSGLYAVTFEAFDGLSVDKEVVFIQVAEAGNQLPVFDSIPTATTVEGDTVTVGFTAFDPDGGTITLSVIPASLPANATFSSPSAGVGQITFNPNFIQAGVYNVQIIATDGTGADTITVVITVNDAGNQPPTIASIGTQSGKELRNLTFTVSATDIDGPAPLLSSTALPLGANFVTSTGVFSWTPSDVQAGNYFVTFFATDAAFPADVDSEVVIFNIADTNRVPNIIAFGNVSIPMFEGDTARFTVRAVDPDGTFPLMRATLSGLDSLATNMSLFDSGNGAATVTFTPSYSQGGTPSPIAYAVRFVAKDAVDTTLIRTASTNVTFNVTDRNQLPVLSFPLTAGPFTRFEGASLNFNVVTNDFDSPVIPSLIVQNLPSGATFNVVSNTGTFNWTPSFSQSGTYNPRFITIDNRGGADTQVVTIFVAEAGNQSPVFITGLADTINVTAGALNEITVRSIDPESQLISLTFVSFITSYTFADSTNGAGTLAYTPLLSDLGNVDFVQFIATDPLGAADTLVTNLRVVNFLRGDVDDNARYTMNDLVTLLGFMFRGGTSPEHLEAADVNADSSVNIADVTYLVNYLYFSGPRPPN